MHLRRLISVLSVGAVVVSGVVAAAPKKADKKKKPPAAAKGSAETPATGSAATPPAGSAAGSGSGSGSAEEGPPKDIEGREENPDNPKATGMEVEEPPTNAPPPKPTGYPIELAQRPITLLKGMGEVSISPHTEFSDFLFVDRLRARYGITSEIQVGLTYAYGALYNEELIMGMTKAYDFHAGKAVGLDVQYLITKFLAVKVGVPIYVDPVAVSLQLGAPMKFHITDKFAIGGLDDLLNIKLSKFPVEYECIAYGTAGCGELDNAKAAQQEGVPPHRLCRAGGECAPQAHRVRPGDPAGAAAARAGLDERLPGAGRRGLPRSSEKARAPNRPERSAAPVDARHSRQRPERRAHAPKQDALDEASDQRCTRRAPGKRAVRG